MKPPPAGPAAAPAPAASAGRLSERIYGAVLEYIAAENLAEGDRLPSERELAARFQASRPIVREVLTRLSSDGLVESRRGAGAFVRRRPSEHLMMSVPPVALGSRLGAYEVRLALEGEAARHAAARRTEEDLAALAAALSDLTAALAQGASTHRPDLALHRAIALATKNPVFVSAFDHLQELVTDIMRAAEQVTSHDGELARRMSDEHATIVDAIRARDGDGAAVAMRHHLYEGRRRLMR